MHRSSEAGVLTRRLDQRALNPQAPPLLRALRDAAGPGAAPVLVGGAVRDALLGRPGVDLDVAVTSGALAIARRTAERVRGSFVPLDRERGTARIVVRGLHLDVADLRGPTLDADLAGRDYTVNALAVPLATLLAEGRARVIDPTGGLADLTARRLRFPAVGALADDPLRALRGARLEAALGFRLTPAAARAIRVMAVSLAGVAAERVRDELVAVLGRQDAARTFRRLDALGLLAVILPEVEAMRATAQPSPHRFAVLEHSLRALAGADRVLAHLPALRPFGDELAVHLAQEIAGGIDRRHTLKLGALLHDVAKPETRRVVGGRVRFFEHDVRGAERVRGIGARLRLPERVATVLERLVRHHLRPMHLAETGGITRRARYRFFRDLGPDARDLLLLALVDGAAVTGASPLSIWPQARLIRDLLGGLSVDEAVMAAPPLLRGEDVMQHFDLRPGPAVGRLLAQVKEAQALGFVGTREEALAFLDSTHSAH